ncbi:hypothetical protein GJ496_010012 [Pomphorhynchus laevis]|nr:hypothetical protein GJ496_010012 [Pomphorhynchus laevis]
MNQENAISVERIFRYIDKDEDGFLNLNECIEALRSCGYKILDKGYALVRNAFENTGDLIEENKFVELCKTIENYQPIAAEELRQSLVFFSDDSLNTGTTVSINLKTLRHALISLCDMDGNQLDKWFQELKNRGEVDDKDNCNIEAFVQFAMDKTNYLQ